MPTVARAKRLLYLTHRWTGVAACLLMALWLVSGVVMLFVGYPKLLPTERLAALPPLAVPGCCVPVDTALALSRAPLQVPEITLTTVMAQPVYRIKETDGRWLMVAARTGARLPAPGAQAAASSARAFLPGWPVTVEGTVDDDRWTHSGGLDSHRPLFLVQVHDPAGTRLYVSSTTGEVVMDVSRAERGWNLVGAWLHWLYAFRDGSKDPVWTWLVIGLSALGTLGAVSGAVVGVWRWRFTGRYASGARSPYRDMPMRWHHIAGLMFGTVLIAWVFSGLMSMNPFGLFDAASRPDLAAYRGGVPGQVRPPWTPLQALERLQRDGFEARELSWRVVGGSPHLLARDGRGATRLLVEREGRLALTEQVDAGTLAVAGARLFEWAPSTSAWLQSPDAYFVRRSAVSMYGGSERQLPVLRMDFQDRGQTAVYLDPRTGDVVLSVDRAQRIGRWLFNFLHSWDLPAVLRFATLREVTMTGFSFGALLIALTGILIGGRRVLLTARRRRPAG